MAITRVLVNEASSVEFLIAACVIRECITQLANNAEVSNITEVNELFIIFFPRTIPVIEDFSEFYISLIVLAEFSPLYGDKCRVSCSFKELNLYLSNVSCLQ